LPARPELTTPLRDLAHYCALENKVSLGFVEGLNTKIRVIQRPRGDFCPTDRSIGHQAVAGLDTNALPNGMTLGRATAGEGFDPSFRFHVNTLSRQLGQVPDPASHRDLLGQTSRSALRVAISPGSQPRTPNELSVWRAQLTDSAWAPNG